jgi:hypothetical protein
MPGISHQFLMVNVPTAALGTLSLGFHFLSACTAMMAIPLEKIVVFISTTKVLGHISKP